MKLKCTLLILLHVTHANVQYSNSRDIQERLLYVNHSKLQMIVKLRSTLFLRDVCLLRIKMSFWYKPKKLGYNFDILNTREQDKKVTVSAKRPMVWNYVYDSPTQDQLFTILRGFS